jgi:hypothetical protein
MLLRLMLLDALAAEADAATVRRLATLVRDSGTHLVTLLDRRRNAQAHETCARWHRMASALLDGDAVVTDLAVSIERRRERNRGVRA